MQYYCLLWGYLNAWYPPSSASWSPFSAPFLMERASVTIKFPQQKLHHLISHIRKWQNNQCESTLAKLLASLHQGGETFVQDEIEAGWSLNDKLWPTCLLYAAIYGKCVCAREARVPENSAPWSHITIPGMGRGYKKIRHAAFLVITRSLTNNRS